MGLCKGNRGNLMQHWVLCDVLERLAQVSPKHLLFVCSHSMAPWSVPVHRDKKDACRNVFDEARRRLAESRASLYEKAWDDLDVAGGLPYPSSAVFAQKVWSGPLSLMLCEKEAHVFAEIEGWCSTLEMRNRCKTIRVHKEDWREAFEAGLPTNDCDLIFIEMDPMRFECNGPERCARQGKEDTLFPEDLYLVGDAIRATDKPVVLQISSYSSQNDNAVSKVEKTIIDHLRDDKFVLDGRATVGDGQMISLVLCRGIQLYPHPYELGSAFDKWLRGVAQ